MEKQKFRDLYNKYAEKAKKISEDKTEMYGAEAIGELGLRAEFLQIHRKYGRLKKMVWENNNDKKRDKNYQDSLEDTYLDLINYCLISLAVMHEENNKIKLTNGGKNGEKTKRR